MVQTRRVHAQMGTACQLDILIYTPALVCLIARDMRGAAIHGLVEALESELEALKADQKALKSELEAFSEENQTSLA